MERYEAVAAMAEIKYPNAEIRLDSVDYGYGNKDRIIIKWTVKDTEPPHKETIVYSQRGIIDLKLMTKKALISEVRSLIHHYVTHEADEIFSVNGCQPFHPHVEDAHFEAKLHDKSYYNTEIYGIGEFIK